LQKLHASRLVELMERVDHLRSMLLQLLQRRAAHAVAHPEAPLVLTDHIEHRPICRQVALGRYLPQDLAVLVFVEVMPIGIEDAVTPQAEWLMDLEIKTDRSHSHVPVSEDL